MMVVPGSIPNIILSVFKGWYCGFFNASIIQQRHYKAKHFLAAMRTFKRCIESVSMVFFLILITLFYCLLIGALIFGWKKIPEFHRSGRDPGIKFSVIVPYRNEAENLPALLHSFSQVQYPREKFEILLVNDGSTDTSENVCSAFKNDHPELQLKLINNFPGSKSPKKAAILTGIKASRFDHIITTDADGAVQDTWLQNFNDKILETGAKLVAGPVQLFPPADVLQKGKRYFLNFQEMDFLSLQAAGAGGFGLERPFICNGANLCYSKSAFEEVNGFSGNAEISSGDDVFLLQKFTERKLPVAFLKSTEAIVFTQPQPNLKALVSQRIRWAAKTPAYKSLFAKIMGLTVLLTNFSILIGGFLALYQLIPYQAFLLIFLLKFNLDFSLIYQSAKFFNRQEVLRNYFWSSLLYPFFSVYVAVLSLFRGFEWKGRKFSK